MNHWAKGQPNHYWLSVEVDGHPRHLWLRPLAESYQKTWLCELLKYTVVQGKKRSATFKAETIPKLRKRQKLLLQVGGRFCLADTGGRNRKPRPTLALQCPSLPFDRSRRPHGEPESQASKMPALLRRCPPFPANSR